MILIRALACISSVLLLNNLPPSVYAQQINQGMGSFNICGTQVIGNNSIITCNVNTWPLSNERKNDLVELCRRENFGRIPSILFMTKKAYNVGEIISIKYSGACPNKTEFLITPQSTNPDNGRNAGMMRRSEPVSDYEAEMEFDDRPLRPGKYVIHAYFADRSRRQSYIAGISLPFEILKRN